MTVLEPGRESCEANLSDIAGRVSLSMACHREFFRVPDLDDRKRRLPFGKRGCEHFFEIRKGLERPVARHFAGFGVDQVDGPAGGFPFDRTPVDTCKFRRNIDWIVETDGFP